ncbi:SHOCT domain-containing protein [Rhodospirillaceae bacterium RKSG073]|nr:SHOCT domain-containing protein [Curvivirga aplysinae]
MDGLPYLKMRIEDAHGAISDFYIENDRRNYMAILENNDLVFGDVKASKPGVRISAHDILGCEISDRYNTEVRQVGKDSKVSNSLVSLNLEIRLNHPTSPLVKLSFLKEGIIYDKAQNRFVATAGGIKKFHALICNIIQKTYTGTVAEVSQDSGADELAKYFALLNQGAITQEEFDQKKMKILDAN